MAQKPDDKDHLAREVDRLLKKLPGADPMLRGTPEPTPRPAGVTTTGPRPAIGRPAGPVPPNPQQMWGLWGRVALAVVFGAALTQWPYRTTCGWPLLGYLAAVAVLLLTAGWAAVAAWRLHIGAAHALALVAAFWGIVLAAEQILPRVGYAGEAATWRCRAPAVAPASPRAPALPAAPPPGDSARP